MKTMLCVLATFVAVLAMDRPAVAHHSFAAEFDANQPITINGAVSKMDWVAEPGIHPQFIARVALRQ